MISIKVNYDEWRSRYHPTTLSCKGSLSCYISTNLEKTSKLCGIKTANWFVNMGHHGLSLRHRSTYIRIGTQCLWLYGWEKNQTKFLPSQTIGVLYFTVNATTIKLTGYGLSFLWFASFGGIQVGESTSFTFTAWEC